MLQLKAVETIHQIVGARRRLAVIAVLFTAACGVSQPPAGEVPPVLRAIDVLMDDPDRIRDAFGAEGLDGGPDLAAPGAATTPSIPVAQLSRRS